MTADRLLLCNHFFAESTLKFSWKTDEERQTKKERVKLSVRKKDRRTTGKSVTCYTFNCVSVEREREGHEFEGKGSVSCFSLSPSFDIKRERIKSLMN